MGRGGKYQNLAKFKEDKEKLNKLARTLGFDDGTMPYGNFVLSQVSIKLWSFCKLKLNPG